MHTRRTILLSLLSLMLLAAPGSLSAAKKLPDSGNLSTGKFTHYWKDYRFRVWLEKTPFKAGAYQKMWLKIDRKAKGKWWYITLAETFGKVFPKKSKKGITGFGLLERKRGRYLGRFKVDRRGKYRLVIRMEDHGTTYEFPVSLHVY